MTNSGTVSEKESNTYRIVVGVDGSEPSTLALRWAIDQADRSATPYGAALIDPKIFSDAADKLLDTVVDAADESELEAPIRRTVVQGSPAHAEHKHAR